MLSQPGEHQNDHVYAFYPLDSGTERSCWGPYVGHTSHNVGGAVNRACAGDEAEGESKAQVSPQRGDSVPSGCGSWPEARETWGRPCLPQGWVLSLSLEGAAGQAAAPPQALLLDLELCSLGRPVPKAGSGLQAPALGKQESFLGLAPCCQLSSGAEAMLTT